MKTLEEVVTCMPHAKIFSVVGATSGYWQFLLSDESSYIKTQSKGELCTFLGMITYLGTFLPNLSMLTAPRRQLMETNVVWIWEPRHQRAFVELKRLVSETPGLKFYDVNQPVWGRDNAMHRGESVRQCRIMLP